MREDVTLIAGSLEIKNFIPHFVREDGIYLCGRVLRTVISFDSKTELLGSLEVDKQNYLDKPVIQDIHFRFDFWTKYQITLAIMGVSQLKCPTWGYLWDIAYFKFHDIKSWYL